MAMSQPRHSDIHICMRTCPDAVVFCSFTSYNFSCSFSLLFVCPVVFSCIFDLFVCCSFQLIGWVIVSCWSFGCVLNQHFSFLIILLMLIFILICILITHSHRYSHYSFSYIHSHYSFSYVFSLLILIFILITHSHYSFSHLFSYSFLYSFIHSFVHPSIHPSIHPCIHPSIHSFIALFTYISPRFLFMSSTGFESGDDSTSRISWLCSPRGYCSEATKVQWKGTRCTVGPSKPDFVELGDPPSTLIRNQLVTVNTYDFLGYFKLILPYQVSKVFI